MNSFKTILGVLLIFILGAVTGGFVTAALAKKGADRLLSGGSDLVSDVVVRRLGSQLDLSADQKSKLNTIVEEARGKIKSIRAEAQPKVKDVLETAAGEIRAILTPEQQKKFEKISKKGRQKLKQFSQ